MKLVAIQRVLKSLKTFRQIITPNGFTGKKNACSIVQKGSIRQFLKEIALDIFSFCSRHCISIKLERLTRHLNERADSLSRGVEKGLFQTLSPGSSFPLLSDFTWYVKLDWEYLAIKSWNSVCKHCLLTLVASKYRFKFICPWVTLIFYWVSSSKYADKFYFILYIIFRKYHMVRRFSFAIYVC